MDETILEHWEKDYKDMEVSEDPSRFMKEWQLGI